MKKRSFVMDKAYLIFLRYVLILGLIFTLPLIYKIFTPLTLYPTSGLLSLIYDQVIINQNIISINNSVLIQLIPACIAGSAYLLLLILNLSVSMNIKKRIFSIIISFAFLLILNIIRIFLLGILYVNKNSYFDITHKLFWYGLSTIFVIALWFLTIKIFSIKQIPVYSDMKYYIKNIRRK